MQQCPEAVADLRCVSGVRQVCVRCASGVSLLCDDAGPHAGAAHCDPLRPQQEAVPPPELPPSSLTGLLDSAAGGKSIHTNTDVIDQYALKRQGHMMRNSYPTFLRG